jgi:hypothetical protein
MSCKTYLGYVIITHTIAPRIRLLFCNRRRYYINSLRSEIRAIELRMLLLEFVSFQGIGRIKHFFCLEVLDHIGSYYLLIFQGFVQSLSYHGLSLVLISRRSKFGSPKHGIDDNGFVSNFVETEMMVVLNSFLFSHVQVKGNVPAFWTVEGNSVKLTRSLELTNTAFFKHINYLQSKYERVFCLNLLSEYKSNEQVF